MSQTLARLPIRMPVRIYRGDNVSWSLRWGSRSGNTTTYYDLSGYTVRLSWRLWGATTAFAQYVGPGGNLVLNVSPSGSPQPGWILIRLQANQTRTFPVGPVNGDLELTSATGVRTTLVRFFGSVEEDITIHV